MTKVIATVHPVHLMNADWAPAGRQPSDQASRLGLWVRRKLAAIIHINHRRCYYYSARKLILIASFACPFYANRRLPHILLIAAFLAYFSEVRISHIFRINWRFRRQFWYYLCVYYRLVLGFVLLNHYYSLFHSRLKTLIPFLRIFPTAAFLFFFRTDYMDSPDCLLLLISVFTFEFFFCFTLFSCRFRAVD